MNKKTMNKLHKREQELRNLKWQLIGNRDISEELRTELYDRYQAELDEIRQKFEDDHQDWMKKQRRDNDMFMVWMGILIGASVFALLSVLL